MDIFVSFYSETRTAIVQSIINEKLTVFIALTQDLTLLDFRVDRIAKPIIKRQ